MKKLLMTVLFVVLSIIAFSQEERTLKSVELNSGTTLIGYISKQSDGTFKIETTDGDIFVFSPSEIRRVVGHDNSSSTDGAKQSGQIVYKQGSVLKLCSTGNPVTQDDFYSFKMWDEYVRAQRLVQNVGGSLLGWGIGLFVSGGIAIGLDAIINGEPNSTASELGLVGCCLGLALGPTGIIIKIAGHSKINTIGEQLNSAPAYSIDFGAQRYGIGLAMKF